MDAKSDLRLMRFDDLRNIIKDQ